MRKVELKGTITEMWPRYNELLNKERKPFYPVRPLEEMVSPETHHLAEREMAVNKESIGKRGMQALAANVKSPNKKVSEVLQTKKQKNFIHPQIPYELEYKVEYFGSRYKIIPRKSDPGSEEGSFSKKKSFEKNEQMFPPAPSTELGVIVREVIQKNRSAR